MPKRTKKQLAVHLVDRFALHEKRPKLSELGRVSELCRKLIEAEGLSALPWAKEFLGFCDRAEREHKIRLKLRSVPKLKLQR